MASTAAATAHQPVRTKPFPGMGPRFDGRELEYLQEALKRNSLFYNQPDGFVVRMLARAAKEFGVAHAVATSSGTASLHVGVQVAGVEAGYEVITSPITDMGTAIAILYQNAIPVFADVDDRTYNITAESIEKVMTDRTRAVIVVHLAGGSADLDAIAKLCKSRGVALIEDCAQALGAKYRGRSVGTVGQTGCFSLNDWKHLSAGDGGFVLTNDEKAYFKAHNCADKYYDRHAKGVRLTALAPNYRMTELQGAVALAQLDRLWDIAKKRQHFGDRLSQLISDIPGIMPHKVLEGAACSYWFYMMRIDETKIGMSRDEFSKRVNAEGIPAGAGYITRPLCHEEVFLKKNFFPGGVWPAEVVAGRKYDYSKVKLPNTEKVLATSVRMPIHEFLTDADVDDMAAAIRKVATQRG